MKRPHGKSPFPSKDDIVAFIGQQPGKVGTREIARAFGMKNADRAALKTMLRELGDEGRVEQRRKKLHHPGTLPHVVVADVTARDRDGELIAVPTEWDEAEHGPAPKIRLRIPRRPRPNEVAGIGDRVLLRVEDSGDKDDPIHHTGRIIKLIDRGKQRVLGIFRATPGGGGGSSRSTRSNSVANSRFPPAPARTPATAIWSRSRWRRAAAAMASRARG